MMMQQQMNQFKQEDLKDKAMAKYMMASMRYN